MSEQSKPPKPLSLEAREARKNDLVQSLNGFCDKASSTFEFYTTGPHRSVGRSPQPMDPKNIIEMVRGDGEGCGEFTLEIDDILRRVDGDGTIWHVNVYPNSLAATRIYSVDGGVQTEVFTVFEDIGSSDQEPRMKIFHFFQDGESNAQGDVLYVSQTQAEQQE